MLPQPSHLVSVLVFFAARLDSGMRKFWLGLLGLFLMVPVLWARYLPSYYFLEEQAKVADLIAILEPISTTKTKDANPHPKAGAFVGQNTVFRVVAVLKGRAPSSEQLTVLHFRHAKKGEAPAGAPRIFVNGPGFAEFPVTNKMGPTQYLGFLKKRPDGRYEAMVGQFDSAYSFRLLGSAAGG